MTDQRLRLFISKRIRGLLSGEHVSRQLSTRGFDLEEKRKFRLGDDPRSVDILATAKRGTDDPRVAVNKIEKGANLIFLMDCSASVRFGTLTEKYRYAVDFIRQITLSCVGGGNRFRFVAFDERVRYDSGFTTSANTAGEYIQELSRLPSGKGITDLKTALGVLLSMTGRFSLNIPSLIFIVSDFLFEPNFGRQLDVINEQSDVIVIVLRDPAELLLPKPYLGLVRLVDPETGKEFTARGTVNPLDKVLSILKRCGIDWLETNTGCEIGKALENLITLFEKRREG